MIGAGQQPVTGDRPRLQIMGPLRVWRDGTELEAGPRQQRCLLALLLAREGRPITMPDLVELLWGPDSPVSAVNVIHKYVGALRRLLEPGLPLRSPGSFLSRHGNGYCFVAGPESLDLAAFRQSVAAAKAEQAEPGVALDHYLEALGRCQGTAGEGLAESSGASATFAGIDSEFFDAAVAAADLALRLGRSAEVLAPLRQATTMSPLNEPVHATLVTALAAAGHQAEALAAYRVIRERLADELGIDPGQGLQEAQRRALTQAPPPDDDDIPLPWVHPAQLPPDLPSFVGRTAELATLGGLVDGMPEAGPLLVALDGMGGVGKSTLAARFAHTVAGRFTDGQLYLDLRGHQSEESVPAGDALRSLLYALGVAAAEVPDTFDARTGMYRSLTAGKRILLLLDNVRDAAQVRPLLPSSATSLVLVTSRRPLVGLAAFDGAHLLRVELPELPEARELLERRLTGVPNAQAGEGTVDEIIGWCGRLPLALAILGARIAARPRLSLDTVATELRDGARRLAAFGGGGVSDPRTAFSWSYRQLTPGAARLFRLLSLTPDPGITAAACVSLSGQPLSRTRDELDELTEAALVTEDDSGRFTSHVLVKAYADELCHTVDPEPDRRTAVTRLLQYYLNSSFNAQVVLQPTRTPIAPPPPLPGVVPEQPGTYEEAIGWFAGQRSVLKEAVRLAADTGGILPWQLAITMQQYVQWAGYFQDWEDVMRSALHAAREHGDAVGEAHMLRSLAGARYSFGAYDESLSLSHGALRIYEERGMPLEQALVHSNFQQTYGTLGRHEEALEHSEKALALLHDLGNHSLEIFVLMAKGRSLAALGRLTEAAGVLDQAFAVHEEFPWAIGEGELRTAIAANLVALGRTAEAVQQFELGVAAAREVGHRPNEFDALLALVELLIDLGDVAGAVEAAERARTVLQEFQGGGPDFMRAAFTRLAAKLP